MLRTLKKRIGVFEVRLVCRVSDLIPGHAALNNGTKNGLEIMTVVPSFHNPYRSNDEDDRGENPNYDKENSDQSIIRVSRFCIRLRD